MRPVNWSTSQFRIFKLFVVLGSLLLPVLCHAAAPANSAYVYVGWYNRPNANQTIAYHITAFSVAADGTAQSVPGSPFHGPSHNLAMASSHLFGDDGRYIQSYGVAANGSLTATSRVDDFAYIPGGGDYWAVYALNPDRAGQTLNTVVSCGSCNSYVFPWAVGADGQLSHIASSGLPDGPAKWAGVMTFSPDNRFAFTSEWEGSLGTLQRNSNGSLRWINPGFVNAPPLPDPAEQVCMMTDFASSEQGYVIAAWYGGGPGCNPGYIIANYTVASNGLLQQVPDSAFTPQVYETAMAFDPTGSYLAIAGNGVQIYKLQSNGTLSAVGNTSQVPGAPGFQKVLWDGAGHVYALTQDCYQRCGPNYGLYIFNFDGQALTAAPGSPHAVYNATSLAVIPE